MIKLLPIGFLIIAVVFGFFYLRISSKPFPKNVPLESNIVSPVKVEPVADERIKNLESSVGELMRKVGNSTPLSPAKNSSAAQSSPEISEERLKRIEDIISELKSRVGRLEQPTAVQPASESTPVPKFPLYIPLGSGSFGGGDRDWTALSAFTVLLDPADYSGYSGMQLEVTMRFNGEAVGTAYARLYNLDGGSTVSYSDVSTTSGKYVLLTSSSFKLGSGKKTYQLQYKSSQGYDVSLQSARIKVSF